MQDSPPEGNDRHADEAQEDYADWLADFFPDVENRPAVTDGDVIVIIRGTANPDGSRTWSHQTTLPVPANTAAIHRSGQRTDIHSATIYETSASFTQVFKDILAFLINFEVLL